MSNTAHQACQDGGNGIESKGAEACSAVQDLLERLDQPLPPLVIPGEKKLAITQINLKGSTKRLNCLAKVLVSDPQVWGIVAIQDVPKSIPWPTMPLRRSHNFWYNSRCLLTEDDHPMHRDPESAPPEMAKRVAFLVPRAIPTTDWRVEAPDWAGDMLATLRLETPSGEILIHNVYNNSNNGGFKLDIRRLINDCSSERSVLLGDFNLHHKLWTGLPVPGRTHPDATMLANATTSHGLHLCNTPGVITYTRSACAASGPRSTIDLTFLGPFLAHQLVEWSVMDVEGFDSDHRVVRTTLDCPPNRQISIRRRWKETSMDMFCTDVQESLRSLPEPDLGSNQGIDASLWKIVKVVEDAIRKHVPSHDVNEPIEAPAEETPESQKTPKSQKTPESQNSYKETVTSTSAGDNRSSQRWATQARRRAQPTQSPFTPDFHHNGQIATTGLQKADMYMEAVYGAGNTSRERSVHPDLPPDVDYSQPPGHPLERMVPGDQVVWGDVYKSIRSLPDRKATGVDIIGNEALKMVDTIITPYLEDIFAACLSRGHYPGFLKISRTILFLKLGKPKDRPTAYRPIALLTSVGKLLERVIVRHMHRALESLPESQRHILNLRQFGGLPGKSTTAALHNLTSFVFQAWTRNEDATALGLDMSGAFPHAHRQRLIKILVDMHIPGHLIKIIWSWLCDRQTILEIPGHEGHRYYENSGLPQGSCLSPLLFLIFASPIFKHALKIHNRRVFCQIFAFVDDTYIIARSRSISDNCKTIELVHAGIMEWASENGVTFDPGKYGLIHFPWKKKSPPVTLRPSIANLPPDEVLFAKPYLVILGVRVDSQLSWCHHLEHISARVSKNMRCLKEISGANWGPRMHQMRTIYHSQIHSIMTYASPAWFVSGARRLHLGTASKKLVNDLDGLQAECLVEISGAMRTTAADVLRKELCIPKLSNVLGMRTISYFAKKLNSPIYKALRGGRPRESKQHPFDKLEALARYLESSARARMTQIHGEAAEERWKTDSLRARAIDNMAKQVLHQMCSSDWDDYRQRCGQTPRHSRPPVLAEPWGPQSQRYYKDLAREEGTLLLHCRTGHIGLAAHLYRFGLHPTDRCPLCDNGPHTVEHLFIHCSGRSCTGQEMARKRAALYKRVGGETDLVAILTGFPIQAARFARSTFGIPQFTKASWKVTEAKKRGLGPEVLVAAGGEPPAKRPRRRYLDLRSKKRGQACPGGSQQAG